MAAHRPAKTVVQDATKEGPEAFMVDDKPFPWAITVVGASATKINEDFFVVKVTVICASFEEILRQNDGENPVIDGIKFPWALIDNLTYRYSRTDAPMVELAFAAESITGVPIDIEKPVLDSFKIKDITGSTVALSDEYSSSQFLEDLAARRQAVAATP